jgi:hypothetical protein
MTQPNFLQGNNNDADRPGVAPFGVVGRANSAEFDRLPSLLLLPFEETFRNFNGENGKNLASNIETNLYYILRSKRRTRILAKIRRVLVFLSRSRHH